MDVNVLPSINNGSFLPFLRRNSVVKGLKGIYNVTS